MSGDGGDPRTPPLSPAAKRRRPGPLLKETEAAQALTQLTTWGGLETAGWQVAPTAEGGLETTPHTGGSLDTAGGQEIPEGERSPQGAARAAPERGSLETPAAEEKGALETTATKMGRLDTALTEEKGVLETAATKMGRLDTALTEEKGVLETAATKMGRLDTALTEEKGVLETAATKTGRLDTALTEEKGVLETAATKMGRLDTALTEEKGVLETAATKTGRLDTALTEEKGVLETAATKMGRLDTSLSEEKGVLETAATKMGRLDTALSEETGVLETAAAKTGRLDPEAEEQGGLEAAEGRRKRRAEEECSIISVGEEEEEEEEEGARLAPRTEQYLEALEAVQLELEAVNEQAGRAFRCLKAKFSQVRRPHLERRNAIIQNIPGFWVSAVPWQAGGRGAPPQQVGGWGAAPRRGWGGSRYLSSCCVFLDSGWPVSQPSPAVGHDQRPGRGHPELHDQPAGGGPPACQTGLQDQVLLLREPLLPERGDRQGVPGGLLRLVSHSTPIRWWRGQDPQAHSTKSPETARSFFAWFGDHSFPAGDRIAEIIKEDLWPNPLQYYRMGENGGPGEDSGTENGDDCVVIVDDEDEEVQEIVDEEEDWEEGGAAEELPEAPRGRDSALEDDG